jgi:hypothetical protein
MGLPASLYGGNAGRDVRVRRARISAQEFGNLANPSAAADGVVGTRAGGANKRRGSIAITDPKRHPNAMRRSRHRRRKERILFASEDLQPYPTGI